MRRASRSFRSRRTPRTLSAGAVLAALIVAPSSRAADDIEFSRDIRPLLSDKCFHCHGPDATTREGNLRLDVEEGVFQRRGRRRVPVVAGQPSRSAVFRRITADDPDDRMPPPDSGKSLSESEIELIRRWIEQGAEWQGHWSLISPTRPPVPEVTDTAWPRTTLDRFVLARLETEMLRPSPEADRRTWIRRVTLDLTGLPPTIDEVERFVADTSADAYEKVVDRLLGSPAYGEHQARFWLDAARYGDTHGLHLDNYREIWPYRDWVIRAFNANLGWDEFTVKNLAGDLLPGATLDDLVASGFNRCHITTSEGGSIAEEVYVRNVVDRVSTVGTVFLGLTTGCAVCHDHKFDPFTMRDFYSMFAFFNNLDANPLDGNAKAHAPVTKVPTETDRVRSEEYAAKIRGIETRLAGPWPGLDARQAEWEKKWTGKFTDLWTAPPPASASSSGGATLSIQDDRSVLATGANPPKDVYTVELHVPTGKVSAVRLEALTHSSYGGKNGRASNGNAVLSEFELEAIPLATPGADPTRVRWASASADHSQKDYPIANAIDGKVDDKNGWATEGYSRAEARNATFVPTEPFGFDGGTLVRCRLRFETQFAQHAFGRVRVSISTRDDFAEVTGAVPPEGLAAALAVPAADRDEAQAKLVRAHYRESTSSEWKSLSSELAELNKAATQLEASFPTTLIMKERASPRPAYLLRRGQYDLPDKELGELPRAVPSAFPPLPENAPVNRLGFAQWLIASEHPLLARVTVNRFWQQFFGRGIVETAEDFGSQGAWPTHPRLLDWLAVEFRESGWDVKQLFRTIALSATYRQSSRAPAELWQRDPQNRLLARGPRFRLDAESLRDQALSVSGLLVERVGGPPVKPPQPDGLWKAVAYVGSNTMKFTADKGPEKVHRRSLYTFWKRTAPAPQMTTFDAPSRESCTVRRERTNTPLQALLLLNDPQYVEAARHLALRALRECSGSPSERAGHLLRLATLRPATDGEVEELVAVYEDRLAFYRSHPDEAKAILAIGEPTSGDRPGTAELAAWTLVGNVVLNLDEVLTKE